MAQVRGEEGALCVGWLRPRPASPSSPPASGPACLMHQPRRCTRAPGCARAHARLASRLQPRCAHAGCRATLTGVPPALLPARPVHRLPCSGWLDFLREVRARVAQVVLLTCPTDRLGTPNKAQARRVVAERNQLLRQMVARSLGGSADSDADGMQEQGSARGRDARAEGSVAGAGVGRAAGSRLDGAAGVASGRARPLMLLDMDALTQRVSERTTIAPEDYHYQCYLSSDTQYQGGRLRGMHQAQ